jgi:hypothetical protein
VGAKEDVPLVYSDIMVSGFNSTEADSGTLVYKFEDDGKKSLTQQKIFSKLHILWVALSRGRSLVYVALLEANRRLP